MNASMEVDLLRDIYDWGNARAIQATTQLVKTLGGSNKERIKILVQDLIPLLKTDRGQWLGAAAGATATQRGCNICKCRVTLRLGDGKLPNVWCVGAHTNTIHSSSESYEHGAMKHVSASKHHSNSSQTMVSRASCTFVPSITSKSTSWSAPRFQLTHCRASKRDGSIWRTPRSCAPNTSLSLPLFDDYRGARGIFAVSHAKVLSQCVHALQEAVQDGASKGSKKMKFTIDFPPERSESRAGTLVSRFENNLNFTEKLLAGLGVALKQCERVGGEVNICDNINPQGGGEYLTDDECMVGFRTRQCARLQARSLLILFNAGMDGSTLRQAKSLDSDEDGVVVLVNCGLDRLSWFAKRGFAKYIDEFVAAYYLKAVGNGWLLKSGASPWRTFVLLKGTLENISETNDKPKLVDVETQIRVANARA